MFAATGVPGGTFTRKCSWMKFEGELKSVLGPETPENRANCTVWNDFVSTRSNCSSTGLKEWPADTGERNSVSEPPASVVTQFPKFGSDEMSARCGARYVLSPL